MNILVVRNPRAELSGCDYYRLAQPLGELARHGHSVHLPAPDSGLGAAPGTFSETGLPDDEALGWADVIVARQQEDPQAVAPHWRRWSAFAPTVYDLDDDVWHLDPANPVAAVLYHPGVQAGILDMVRSASLVTVTTGVLADLVGRYNPRVAVLPNRIDGSALDLPSYRQTAATTHPGHRSEPDDTTTVGWTASSSHYRDLYDHLHPLRAFFHTHPKAEPHLMGYDYRPMLGLGNVRYTDWVTPMLAYYAAIDFDVGIAPLSRTTFNRAKSPIKSLEYGARGIPTVAVAGTAYDSFVRHGENGLLVRDPDDWGRHLSALAADPELRRRLGAEARTVAAEHTIQDGWADWEKAYAALG